MMALVLIFVLWSISIVIDSFTAYDTKNELKRIADAVDRQNGVTDDEAMEYAKYVAIAARENQMPLTFTAWRMTLK